MASNLSKEIVNTTVTLAVSGQVLVDEEARTKRFGECINCKDFIPQQSRCNICGCFLQIKVKFASAKCPAGKW
jgi:hypothetical protein